MSEHPITLCLENGSNIHVKDAENSSQLPLVVLDLRNDISARKRTVIVRYILQSPHQLAASSCSLRVAQPDIMR